MDNLTNPNPVQPANNQDAFLGVDGPWGKFLRLGISGAMTGCLIYLMAYELPETRRQAVEDRKLAADDRKLAAEVAEKSQGKSLGHGDSAVVRITDAIDRQTKAIDDNAERHRAVLRDGQREMLELQRELTAALLGARAAKKTEPKMVGPPYDSLSPAFMERPKK